MGGGEGLGSLDLHSVEDLTALRLVFLIRDEPRVISRFSYCSRSEVFDAGFSDGSFSASLTHSAAGRVGFALLDLGIAFFKPPLAAVVAPDLDARIEPAPTLFHVACRRVLVPDASYVQNASRATRAPTATRRDGGT